MSKEKIEKVLTDKDMEPKMVEIPATTSRLVDSFGYCLAALLNHDVDAILEKVADEIDNLDPSKWFDPYRKVINEMGYDTMCFSYSPPVLLEASLENYIFGKEEASKLPIGKCMIMGRAKDELNNQCTKCVIAFIDENRNPVITYDPYPDMNFIYFDNVVYFIDTFMNEGEKYESASEKD